MNNSKKIKGTQLDNYTPSSYKFGATTNPANNVTTLDLSYISMGYIDTSYAPNFNDVTDAACYLVSQYESNDAGIVFEATTVEEVQQDLETILRGYSENGQSLKQTSSFVEATDLDTNGAVNFVHYNF